MFHGGPQVMYDCSGALSSVASSMVAEEGQKHAAWQEILSGLLSQQAMAFPCAC